jgi:SAM-dependent methyltransferase
VTRSALNHQFLADIPKTASILEGGCNLGNQLMLLRQMRFENLTGIEIHKEIVKHAQTRVLGARVMEGFALAPSFDDASFDLIFTAGLLIHIAPHDLPVVMREIHRCSKRWIWGLEHYAPQMTEVPYRGTRRSSGRRLRASLHEELQRSRLGFGAETQVSGNEQYRHDVPFELERRIT